MRVSFFKINEWYLFESSKSSFELPIKPHWRLINLRALLNTSRIRWQKNHSFDECSYVNANNSVNTNRFGLRAIIIIHPIFNAYSERQKTLLKWYVPYYIPAGILMTVFGVRGAKLSLASPISLVWICLLIFLNSLNRLLFSIYFLFFVIYTHTHSWTYSRKNIIKSVGVAVAVSLLLCGFFLSLLL